jgi:hypothetical protein
MALDPRSASLGYLNTPVSFGAIADQVSATTAALNFTSEPGLYCVECSFTESAAVIHQAFLLAVRRSDTTVTIALLGNDSTYFGTTSTDGDAAIIVTSGEVGINCRFSGGIQSLEITKIV